MTGQWRPGGKSTHEVGGDTVASVLRGALGVREAWQAAGLASEQRGAWARAFRRTALPSLVVAPAPSAAVASVTAPATARPASAGRPRRDGTQSLDAHTTRASPSAAERPTEHLVPRMRIIEEHVPFMQIVE